MRRRLRHEFGPLPAQNRRLANEAGFTMVELIGVMAILLIILTAVTTLFVSGSRAQVDLNERFQAQTEARVATDRIRHEKWLACQVPWAWGFFTRSITSATTSSSAPAWAPGTMAPTATIRCST